MDRREELRTKLEELAVSIVADPEKIRDLVDRYRAGFHAYSLCNTILIWYQKPQATLCAGFKAWEKKKRHVLKGQRAIWVLGPYIKKDKVKKSDGREDEESRIIGFFPVPVFDVSQTDGEPLDMGSNKANFIENEITLEELIAAFPEYDTRIVERQQDGVAWESRIEVARRKNKAQMVHSYLHELAHIRLGHTSKATGAINREVSELEAEATATIVAACLGIKSDDAPTYIASWNGNQESLKASAPKILKTADQILRRLNKKEKGKES